MTDRKKAELAMALTQASEALDNRGAGKCVTVPIHVWSNAVEAMRDAAHALVEDIQDTDHDKEQS